MTPKLSVVVAGFNMARELPRTIRSLSPIMQRDIAPDDYEVILVDNGSTQPFDEAELRALLPGLNVHRMRDAGVSPARALNAGLALARGELVGVCVDGARIASPRLLARALAASKLHPRPVVGTVAFHLGHDVQRRSMHAGYGQHAEDELLRDCGWESDPYRLFTVSVFGGSSAGGWFELPSESSALFLRAEHWREIGGWDERFESPGGGYLALSLWRSLCADTTAEVIMLLGEATFHQFHGGVATNASESPLEAFENEYRRIHGEPYERPRRRPLFFGSFEPIGASANARVTGA